jgi:UDP-2-acetamido-3-amino-2,3-dideoxy-glucuronate N-acetyltransferase
MSSPFFVHSSAFVDDGAHIGVGTKIWHFCHIFSGAKIGKDCKIGQNVVVHGSVVIGNNVKLQNNVSLYDGVYLEDDVFCGPSCVFTNIFNPRAAVNRNDPKFYRKTVVRQGATIGANATIVCGVTIGRYAFIGAGAVVTKDVADYALVYGSPAKSHGWMCECGEKIKLSRGKLGCPVCRATYKKSKTKLVRVS